MEHFAMRTPHEQLVETVLHSRACSFLGFNMELYLGH